MSASDAGRMVGSRHRAPARLTARSRSARNCTTRQFATLRVSIATMAVSRTATTWLSRSSSGLGGDARTALAVAMRPWP